MATINYYLQGTKNPLKIYVRVREGVYIDAKTWTKYLINEEDWNSKIGKPKHQKNEIYRKLNNDLEKISNQILEGFNQVSNKTVNSKWLKEIVSPKEDDSELPNELVKYIDYYINFKRSDVQSSTIKKFNVVKHKLERLEKELGKQILLTDVNLKFKNLFEDYCVRNKYAKNTIVRDMKFVKSFCRHARQMGLATDSQLDLIRSNPEKTEKVYLNLDEILKIRETEFEKDSYLDNARDWLLILCFSAQRVSDAMNFSKKNIRVQKGFQLIEFTQVKTKKVMSIPVLPQLKRILDKRDGEFPRKISDVKLNLYIKEVCEKAGLTEMTKGSIHNKEWNRKEEGIYPKYKLVTSHIGRRSFATNYYGEYSTAILKDITGHSSETQFLEYIGKSRTDSAIELAKLFNQE